MIKFVKVVDVKVSDKFYDVYGCGMGDIVVGGELVMVVNGFKVFDKEGMLVVEGEYEGCGKELLKSEFDELLKVSEVLEFEKYIGLMKDEDGLMNIEEVVLKDYKFVNMIFWNMNVVNDVFEDCKVNDLNEELKEFEEYEKDVVSEGFSEGGLIEKFKEKVKGVSGMWVRWNVEYDDNIGVLIK